MASSSNSTSTRTEFELSGREWPERHLTLQKENSPHLALGLRLPLCVIEITFTIRLCFRRVSTPSEARFQLKFIVGMRYG